VLARRAIRIPGAIAIHTRNAKSCYVLLCVVTCCYVLVGIAIASKAWEEEAAAAEEEEEQQQQQERRRRRRKRGFICDHGHAILD